MMPLVNEVMLAAGSSPAASIVAKATVATALGLMATGLARRSRAAVRHALLASAFGVLLVLPIVSMVAPPVRIAVQGAAQELSGQTLTRVTGVIRPAAPASVVRRPTGLSSLPALLLTGWMAGMALFLAPVAMGLWQVRRLRQSALPWRHGQSVVEELVPDAGIHRRVEVLLHAGLAGPMTCGVVHPAIVLPEDAQMWEGENLNCAMVHELEHVRRGDWVSHCLARAVCAVYWFHPLVWMAWRQLALEAERSCDDAVLGRAEATAYADQLVGLAQRMNVAAKSPLLAMANRADLTRRVGAVLDSHQRRGRAGTLSVGLACAAATVLVLTMAPLQVVAAPQAAAAQPQFSAATKLVMVNVIASDQNGKTIEGLRANDFVLTEDGVLQTISIFEFQEAGMAQGAQGSVASYYLLGYYTNNQNGDQFRNIKITSKANNVAKLDYRAGYYTGLFGGADNGGAGRAAVDSTVPLLLYRKDAEYSDEARKAKYQGTAVLNVEVDASGRVTRVEVARSLGLGLDEKAIEAVKQWRFKPGTKDGRAVTTQTQVEVSFRQL